ncbi:hypothetical protein G6011_00272 [Alternaria panax]|uniref:Uncharacterized protein n=1 Tax=Alternaria panax TaxID=48097 RepID=A0AAD4IIE2_9PLEO|nr:hypothetical protein G6011_00272 [Alternaria panax]
MAILTPEQLQQQWMWKKLAPSQQQQQYHDRKHVPRPSQQQNGQPQRPLSPQQQQLQREQFARLSPEQQQLRQQWQSRQQQNAQQRPNLMQFPAQSSNNMQLPRSSGMAPPSSSDHNGTSSQAQASPHSSSVPTVYSLNSLSGANILMSGNDQQQCPPSTPSATLTLTTTASPQSGSTARKPSNTSPPAQHGISPAFSANSHMPTLSPFTTRTQSASLGQQGQQVNASDGSTQYQQSCMSPSNNAHYRQSPLKQGHPHAQTNQHYSPTQKSFPLLAGQKRQITDAPEGTRPADKRPGVYRQANGTINGTLNGTPTRVVPTTKDPNLELRKQQAKVEAERRHIQENQAKLTEQARVAEQYRIAYAAALQREKDDKRREELRKDPSANFRHVLEVYKLTPLKKGDLPNRYLMGLIANRPMPIDLDSELALAITFAKDHWGYYGQWPKDVPRFAEYERSRKAKELA